MVLDKSVNKANSRFKSVMMTFGDGKKRKVDTMKQRTNNVVLHLILQQAQAEFDDQELVDGAFLVAVGRAMNRLCPKATSLALEEHIHVRRVEQNVFVWSDVARLQCEVFLLKFAELFIAIAAEIGAEYEAKLFVPTSIDEQEILFGGKASCHSNRPCVAVEKLGAYSRKNIFRLTRLSNHAAKHSQCDVEMA